MNQFSFSNSAAPTMRNYPPWAENIVRQVSQLLSYEYTLTIHRSKLCALFEDFMHFARTFEPSAHGDQSRVQQAANAFTDVLNKTMQIVFACSAASWTATALKWEPSSVMTSVLQLRKQAHACASEFGCSETHFCRSDAELRAQDKIDIIALKCSLMDYQMSLLNQPQTPNTRKMFDILDRKIDSFGHIEGLEDGPGLSNIPPFLPREFGDCEISHSDYVKGALIGNGTYGSVYSGTMTGTMKKVAVKELKMQTLRGRQLETFKREVYTLASIKHPSVLGLIGVTLTPPFSIVTELLKCSLSSRMSYLTPTRRSIIALKIAQGMGALHAAGIIHRDLKSGNILLNDDDLPFVCDFGLVGFISREVHTGYVGTVQWMAPELLKSCPDYDEKVDVYSFAVLLWELLTCKPDQPYPGMTQDQVVMGVIQQKIRPQIPQQYGPPQLVNLITQCWSEDPKDRPSFPSIISSLMKPEYHFVGTNEEDFSASVPKQSVAIDLADAIETSNWRQFNNILQSLTIDEINKDKEILTTILSLFPKINEQFQLVFLQKLPELVNFNNFLSKDGYTFIISLFNYSQQIINKLIELFQSLDTKSKAFRQAKLIKCLANSQNQNALNFLSTISNNDYDITNFLAQNCLPINSTKSHYPVLIIYKNILIYKQTREILSNYPQPIQFCMKLLKKYPNECIFILSYYHYKDTNIVSELNMIDILTQQVQDEPRFLSVLYRLFVDLPIEYLANYSSTITQLLSTYPQFKEDPELIQKLNTFYK